jgi:hypothetical protein
VLGGWSTYIERVDVRIRLNLGPGVGLVSNVNCRADGGIHFVFGIDFVVYRPSLSTRSLCLEEGKRKGKTKDVLGLDTVIDAHFGL